LGQKKKKIAARGRNDLIEKHSYIDANQEFTRCETTQTSSHSLKDWGDLSLLSSLLYNMKHTHTWRDFNSAAQQPYGSIYM
jgi:hypothetical protein